METLKGGEHRTLILAQYVIDELAPTVRGKARDSLIWPSQTGGHLKPPSTHDSWLSGARAALPIRRATELNARPK